MTCPKNIVEKSFLWKRWKAEGEHDWQMWCVEYWAFDTFEITEKCSYCGCLNKEHIDDVGLVRLNLPQPAKTLSGWDLNNRYYMGDTRHKKFAEEQGIEFKELKNVR
jgi:hypothetical protein